ncbi:hypothetical protein BT93_L1513 [Corymbia citriodora subsp. variegata]|uniref:RING-type E3 ubiquitin transferase n=1 Tax=Corymbia citriodora subsp. variegata TaxID=360336 RepID=A0A8T0CRE6_CORYI|nr:hypothetical protein BT93_L1513 [Corymbia citriodora subsp. variegata]
MDRFYTDSVSHLENVLRSDQYSHLQMMPAEMACKVIVRRRDRYDILPEAAIGHPSDSRAFPAAQEAVDSPEKTNIDGGSQEGLGGAGEPCAICFEDMNLREGGVACMPCKHKLHRNCLARWLKMSNLCPLCRSAMLAGRPA